MIKVKFLDGPAAKFGIADVPTHGLKELYVMVYADSPFNKIKCIYSIGEQIDGVYQCTLKETSQNKWK